MGKVNGATHSFHIMIRLVDKEYNAVHPYEMVLTIASVGHTYYVCVSPLDTIEDLKTFFFQQMNPPQKVFPDEQSYYSMYHGRILENDVELSIVAKDPILLLGFANPLPSSYYIPQRCLFSILVETHMNTVIGKHDPYERMLFLHHSLDTQYLPFLADWLEHDRLIHRIIIDADHAQINWIVCKITKVLATYPACLQQIIFSATKASHLQWDTLHALYTATTVPILLEAHVLQNQQNIIYRGQTERELAGHMAPSRKKTSAQAGYVFHEDPQECDLATPHDLLPYADPNFGTWRH